MPRRVVIILAAVVPAAIGARLACLARAAIREPAFEAVFTSTRKVTAIAVTDSGVELGTEGGLARVRRGGAAPERVTTRDGLPANHITALLPPGAGSPGLLVGTERGAIAIGGLASPPLMGRCVALCQRGGEACAAVGRQVMCLRETGWEALGPPLPSDARCLVEFHSALWAGTAHGLFVLEGESWEPVICRDDPLAATVNALTASGALYVGTVGGLFVREGGEWRSYTTREGLPDNHVTSVGVAGETVYVATYGGGVARLREGRLEGLAGSPPYATALAWDAQESALWVGTEDGGAFRWDGAAWRQQITRNEPPGHNITGLAAGAGELLVGTFEHGVGILQDGAWHDPGAGLNSAWINQVAFGHGRAWARTSAGDLFVRDHSAWHPVTKQSGLIKPWTSFVGSAGGNVWVGTWGAVSKFDGRRWHSYAPKPALADQVVTSVAILDHDIWVGTAKSGLARYNGRTHCWQTYSLGSGLTDTWITSLAVWDGSLWVGTFSGGVCRFDGRRWEHVGAPAPLPSARVNCLAATDCLYVGTLEGLCRFDGRQWTVYSRGDGLPSEIVQSLCVDGERLWVGTPDGLACARLVEAKEVGGASAPNVGAEAPPTVRGTTTDKAARPLA